MKKDLLALPKTFFKSQKDTCHVLIASMFQRKVNNSSALFFSDRCSLIDTNISLPSTIIFLTEYRLSKLNFTIDDICKVIRLFGPNKFHDHDKINIHVLKIYGDYISRPIAQVFHDCLEAVVFPWVWKKGNSVPIHKKYDKQNIKNFRPISLLSVCGKILKKKYRNDIKIIKKCLFFLYTINSSHQISLDSNLATRVLPAFIHHS